MQLVLSGRIQVPPCWLGGPAGPHLDLGMQTLPTQPLHQLSHQSSQSSLLRPLLAHLNVLELRNDAFTRALKIEDPVNRVSVLKRLTVSCRRLRQQLVRLTNIFSLSMCIYVEKVRQEW